MNNEGTICFAEYKDDLSDGVPIKSWIQCTSEECYKWMHEECVPKNIEDKCRNEFR